MKYNQDVDLSRIEAKLDMLIRLLALSVTSEAASLQDRAILLQRTGMTPKDIAALIGTTPNAVSVALYEAKRNGKVRKSTPK